MQKVLTFDNFNDLMYVLGPEDKNVKRFRNEYRVKIWSRGQNVVIEGRSKHVHEAMCAIQALLDQKHKKNIEIYEEEHVPQPSVPIKTNTFALTTNRGEIIEPRTPKQAAYVKALEKSDMVFGVGPAGTGKTFLAIGAGLSLLNQEIVERIILTRPVLEAGEKLGFLPGDFTEKMNPYIKPLEDALIRFLGHDRYWDYRENGVIEIVPLAYMRGRTLENAFIVLDEAQNTTINQMIMFLTRFGAGSRVVVTGDPSQIDLEHADRSGLLDAMQILKNIPDIAFITFSDKDVCRHPLIRKILAAYNIQTVGEGTRT